MNSATILTVVLLSGLGASPGTAPALRDQKASPPHAPSCPPDMARIDGRPVCIDRFEASLDKGEPGDASGQGTKAKARSRRGVLPAVLVSQLQAKAACGNAGKRLCLREEWAAACRGPEGKRAYPYGAKFEKGRCADETWSRTRKSRGPALTGSRRCCTPEGVCDLSGNVWEWLADVGPGGSPVGLVGGGFGNDDRHLSCVPNSELMQPPTEVGSAMGFRCCLDLGT